VVVSGAASGIGLAACRGFARLGAIATHLRAPFALTAWLTELPERSAPARERRRLWDVCQALIEA
jgi:NAD(P)-dependent dehydrogenase (short-subunit alcohol dehydrogenase family)